MTFTFNLTDQDDILLNKSLRFMHIPKTAGTSFADCLLRLHKPANYFQFSGDFIADKQRYAQQHYVNQKILVTGHAPLQTGIASIDFLPTITFLRDPMSRVISHCQYIAAEKSQKKASNYQQAFCMEKFVMESNNPQLENLQTKYLVGFDFYQKNKNNISLLVEQAVNNLANHCLFFGIVESFDESLILLQHTLKSGYPSYRKLNKKSSKLSATISKQSKKFLLGKNSIDLEVYQHAVTAFTERLQQLSDLDKHLKKLNFRQKLCQPYFSLRKIAGKFRKVIGSNQP